MTAGDPGDGQRSVGFQTVVERAMWALVVLAALNLAVAVASLTMTSASPLYRPLGTLVETANPLIVGLACTLLAAVAMFVEKRPQRRVKLTILLALGLGVAPLVVLCVFGLVLVVHGAV